MGRPLNGDCEEGSGPVGRVWPACFHERKKERGRRKTSLRVRLTKMKDNGRTESVESLVSVELMKMEGFLDSGTRFASEGKGLNNGGQRSGKVSKDFLLYRTVAVCPILFI